MRFIARIALAGCVIAVASMAFAAAALASDVLVSNGSPPGPFSKNKQNEPAVAIDQAHPQYVAAGSNDEIDMEDCNAGDPTTCPFTPGVGVSGVYLSSDGGASYIQPVYQGWTARDCIGPPGYTCTPHVGDIGTLPQYYTNGLVSDGDPALAFGPQPDGAGGFSYANGSRLYYVNLASNFPAPAKQEQAFKGYEAIAVSRLDTQDWARATAGDDSAWKAPVIVSKQSSTTFSDKEAVWADNAESSPYFGNVYVCNTSFRSNGAGPEPILFVRSTDGGDTWSNPKQLTPATNNNQTGGRQSCAIRTDSAGVVYLYFEGFDKKTGESVFYQVRSFDGGVRFERPRAVVTVHECGLPDPVTGRYSFDGVAGARTDSFPSVDIANGAPTGADATDEIVMTWCDGPTPSATEPGPNEQALVAYSLDHGGSFVVAGNAAPAGDRPDFPAIAISPDGTALYLTYTNFLQPWQPSALAPPRLAQGVVRTTTISTGAPGSWTDRNRGPTGDARGSSQNNLVAEFLGDYNYAAATRDHGVAVWNDVRAAADCPAIDAYRQALVDEDPNATRPEEEQECPLAFGNSDIFGGVYTP